MELFLHSFQLLRGEDGPGWQWSISGPCHFIFQSKPDSLWLQATSTTLPSQILCKKTLDSLNRFLQMWPLAKIFHVCRVGWLFVNNWLVKNFDLHIDLHHSYHWHQRCWSLSGMSAMWGHGPILFPPLTNVVCAQHNVFVIVCIAALCRSTRGALSS